MDEQNIHLYQHQLLRMQAIDSVRLSAKKLPPPPTAPDLPLAAGRFELRLSLSPIGDSVALRSDDLAREALSPGEELMSVIGEKEMRGFLR